MKKICTKCGENKALEKYSKDPSKKDGRYSSCKDCVKKYRIEHRQQIREYDKKYYKTDKGKLIRTKVNARYAESDKGKLIQVKSSAKYSKTNKGKLTQNKYNKSEKGKLTQSKYRKSEKYKLVQIRYYKTEKNKLRAIRGSQNRRAKEKEILSTLTTKESNIILLLQNYKCIHPDCVDYFDEVEPTLDHIKPVSIGGPLVKDNIQYLCRKHNSKKHTQEIDYRSELHKYMIRKATYQKS